MNQLGLKFDENKDKGLSVANLGDPAILKDFPFDKIYEVSRKEASRKKPVFFVHRYFARRATANFRLLLLSFLLGKDEDAWENFYNSLSIPKNENLKILDPFMGGGTTIFEAVRMGATVLGNDLQPLSRMVTHAEIAKAPVDKIKKEIKKLRASTGEYIKSFYKTQCPECGERADVMYNFWVKTAKSRNDKCVSHDLYSSFVLANRKGKFTLVCPDCLEVFKTVFTTEGADCPKCNKHFSSPTDGFVERGKLQCPECETNVNIRELLDNQEEPLKAKLVAQEYYCPHCHGHDYKSISDEDRNLYQMAVDELEKVKDSLLIPEQLIPDGYNTRQMVNHGYTRFSQMFNERQLLGLGTLLKAIDEVNDEEVRIWLLVAFSASLEMNNMFCRYQSNAFKICNIFFNHAYVPITMPVENNVWGTKLGTGTFEKAVAKLLRAKEFNENIYDVAVANGEGTKVSSTDKVVTFPTTHWSELSVDKPLLTSKDSRSLDHIPSSTIDLVITDPPYGDNLMYSELIDFFHVWLHQSATGRKNGFMMPYSPKIEEVVANPAQNKTYEDYSVALGQVFQECNRVLKDNGYLAFTFHDSKVKGWMSVLLALKQAGFRLIRAYPVHSESRTGAHTSLKESIAYDIFLICEKGLRGQFNNEADHTLEALGERAFRSAAELIERLTEINAELTLPDLENICLSQLFVELEAYDSYSKFEWVEIEKLVQSVIEEIDSRFGDVNIVKRRTGWWSELYSMKNFIKEIG